MLLLKLIGEFPLGLDKTDKAALRTLVDGTRRRVGKWQARKSDFVVRSGDLVLCVEVKTVRDALAHSLVNYARGRRRVVSSPSVLSGEPVFKGTRIPVAQVAGLIAKGVPLAEIAQDYPALTTVDIAYASIHAKMKRNPGRPRKALRLVRKAGARATAGMRRRRS
jgi:uncharacterized protein (DUF433 family)